MYCHNVNDSISGNNVSVNMIDSGDRKILPPKVNTYVDKQRNRNVAYTVAEVLQNVNNKTPVRDEKIDKWVREW